MVSAVLFSVFWRLCKLRHHVNVFQEIKYSTVNPRISPRGLICKNEFLGGGLFQSLAFSSKVDI